MSSPNKDSGILKQNFPGFRIPQENVLRITVKFGTKLLKCAGLCSDLPLEIQY